MSIDRERIRSLVRSTGWDVVRFRGDFARHQQHLLEHADIECVVDVGANEGQYGMRLRRLGFRGDIVSFEPIPAASAILRRRCENDVRWTAHEVAIGDRSGTVALHLSGNSVSSSLLDITPRHVGAEGTSAYVGDVSVAIEPLDSYLALLPERLWLKVDVQGAEVAVLRGAELVLKRTHLIQIEMSLVELYRGAPTLLGLQTHLDQLGFDLIDVERGFTESESGALLQLDGLFGRRGTP